jgi:hypothetical protein
MPLDCKPRIRGNQGGGDMIDLMLLGISANREGPTEQRTACPNCNMGRKDTALGINMETGVYHCFRCGLKGRAGLETGVLHTSVVRINDPRIAKRKRENLRKIWSETIPLNHSHAYAARAYLESRGLGKVLQAPPRNLRAHRGLQYWDGFTNLGTFPALVALFHAASGKPVTLHVTYLRSDGGAKAGVPSPKKIMPVPVRGTTRGGAIQLYEPVAGILGLAEGLESALSMFLLQKIPVWSAYCADNLGRVNLPASLRQLHIGIDIDASGKGEQVAQILAKRMGRLSPTTKIFIVTPEVDGTGDLNDELRRRKYGRC